MKYQLLGDSGISVSAVGMGCEALGGTDWGHVDIDDAMDAVRFAWSQGVNVFDTADVYGLGESERRLSAALGDSRHEAVIVSKFGVRWTGLSGDRAKTWRDSSASYLGEALDASLRRLRIERIPVYLVHWPDDGTPVEDTLGALEEHRLAGKIGVYGVSNFWGTSLRDAVQLGARAVELPLSLVDRRAESELSNCIGAGVIAYGTYAQGLLCGRYGRDSQFRGDDRRHRLAHFSNAGWDSNELSLRRVGEVAISRGVTQAQVALRWVLSNEGISCALIGAKSASQVAEAVAACDLELSQEEYEHLSNTVSQTEPDAGRHQTHRLHDNRPPRDHGG